MANEKDSDRVSCLSIQDLVSCFFPSSTVSEFIQICRKKSITRYKPDLSTDCDSKLRLVNIQQLEGHWDSIEQALTPSTQSSEQPIQQGLIDSLVIE
jgi:CRISPR/Cas system CMR subunit Cmr4 (Cas7 group RAMP superfamily)